MKTNSVKMPANSRPDMSYKETCRDVLPWSQCYDSLWPSGSEGRHLNLVEQPWSLFGQLERTGAGLCRNSGAEGKVTLKTIQIR